MKSTAYWRELSLGVSPRTDCFINGRFAPAASGATFPNVNPATGRTLCNVASGDQEDVDRAVTAARRAFEDGRWQGQSPRDRGKVLIRLADLFESRAEELQLLESLDVGKPIRYTGPVDLTQTVTILRWYGELADKLYDEVAPTGRDAVALITREPVGVVGIITPWNFPMMIAALKLAPALVMGNSVVLKPAEHLHRPRARRSTRPSDPAGPRSRPMPRTSPRRRSPLSSNATCAEWSPAEEGPTFSRPDRARMSKPLPVRSS